MVDAVGYVQVTLPVDPTTVRALQPGVGSFATVAVAALVAPGYGGYDAGGNVYLADGVILGVDHDNVVLILSLIHI